jgi:8-oxo-dGTP pyrophosphatase MutT (NUDIX family)
VLRSEWADNLSRFERVGVDVEPGQRHSAVAVCIIGDAFLMTRRASKLRNHAGQYALPGGRVDPGESAVDAALREMFEEVGLRCADADVAGVLDDYVTRSGFVITPVVVSAESAGDLVPNPDEVAAIYLIPVAELDHPDAPRLLEIPESARPVIQMPMRGGWIHAPTAAILYQFHEVAIHGRPTRVAHFEQPTWAWK